MDFRKVNPLAQRLEDGKSRLSVIFCGEINIEGNGRNAPPRTNLSIPMAAAPEVEAVAIILIMGYDNQWNENFR